MPEKSTIVSQQSKMDATLASTNHHGDTKFIADGNVKEIGNRFSVIKGATTQSTVDTVHSQRKRETLSLAERRHQFQQAEVQSSGSSRASSERELEV